jgi:hypothetical protein
MKRVRRDRERWQPPAPLLANAVLQCRRCHTALTPPLVLLTDAVALGKKEFTSRVPSGFYWLVPAGQDFAGSFAVALPDLIAVGYHPDTDRLLGCCGPSGDYGRNRVCRCGHEVGTERSDCIWPQAGYLDPTQVLAVAPDNEPAASD